MPWRPTEQLAHPEFATIAWERPFFKCSMDTTSEAPLRLLLVYTPAATHGTSE